jgi:hypothetical protein
MKPVGRSGAIRGEELAGVPRVEQVEQVRRRRYHRVGCVVVGEVGDPRGDRCGVHCGTVDVDHPVAVAGHERPFAIVEEGLVEPGGHGQSIVHQVRQ